MVFRAFTSGTFRAAAAVVAALAAGPAAATPPNSWDRLCITDNEDGARLCTTEYHILQDGQEFVLYFAKNPKGTAPFVVESAGLIFSKVTITVDDKEALESSICEPDLCYFENELSAVLLKQFKQGQAAQVVVLGADGAELLNMPITLQGFDAAYSLTDQ